MSEVAVDARMKTLEHAIEPFYSIHELPYGDCPASFFVGIPKRDAPAVLREPIRLATGRGFAPAAARGGCIGEIAEALCLCEGESRVRRRARVSELDGGAIVPGRLACFGAGQLAERQRWNRRYGDHAWIPEPFDEDRVIDWVTARSLAGDTIHVPAAFCFLDHVDEPRDRRVAVADSNGCAVAWSLEEAALRGFLELVERDATGIWWYGMHRRPAVATEQLQDPRLVALQAWYRHQGRSFAVLDLTTDFGVPVCAAVSADTLGQNVALGFAAALDMSRAVSAACAEMLQLELSMHLVTKAHSEEPAGETRHTKMMDIWRRRVSLSSAPQLCAAENKRTHPDATPVAEGSTAEILAWCEQRCRRAGLSFWFVELSRPELPIHAARVIVPGLCHYKAQLGARRLYEVPRALGWCSRRLREEDLSAIPLLI